jgi:hypothetical protein
MTVAVTKHAIERAAQRFNVRMNAAEDWIKARFKGAEFISNTILEDGKEGRLFAKGGVAFVLNAVEDIVITVYKPFNYAVADKVRYTVQRELAKAQRKAHNVERANLIKIAELEVEIASRQLNCLKARSPKIRAIIQKKIEDLNAQVDALNDEIINAKREMTNIAKGVAAYL